MECSVIEEVTKGMERSVRGRQDEDAGECIIGNGGVGKSSVVSKQDA